MHSLRFIGRARDLGFSVEQISALLVLWQDRGRASADVKALALSHAAGLKTKIAELNAMVHTLEHLAAHCHGNERPDCPILTDLAEPAAAPEQPLQASHRASKLGSTRQRLHANAAPVGSNANAASLLPRDQTWRSCFRHQILNKQFS